MKSILALLLFIAVANAGIDKSGGLKGSWTDSFEVENPAPDMAAPGIAYNADVTSALLCDNTGFKPDNMVNTTEDSWVMCTLRFSSVGELTYAQTGSDQYDWEATGSAMATYWTGTAPDTTEITASCSIDYDTIDVTCTFWLYEHQTPGVYNPMITLMDSQGNWAVYTEANFATAGDSVSFTLDDVYPDVTLPMVDATSWTMTPSTGVVLGMLTNIDTSVDVVVTVRATDGEVSSECIDGVTGYDGWSSGLGGVMITATSGDWSMDFTMTTDWTVIDASCYYMYELEFSFYSFFEPGTWALTVTAWDFAGNMNVPLAPATMGSIVVTYDDTALEAAGGVVSCQTFDVYVNILDYNEPLTISATDDGYAYVYLTCVEKDETTSNYASVAFQTETYTPIGETVGVRRMSWSTSSGVPYGGYLPVWLQQSNFGQLVSYTSQDPDTTTGNVNYAPGTIMTAGVWASTVYAYPGWQDGDYELSKVYTITSTGGVQLYDLDLGSASSVVPSIFAVMIAAIVALLRL